MFDGLREGRRWCFALVLFCLAASLLVGAACGSQNEATVAGLEHSPEDNPQEHPSPVRFRRGELRGLDFSESGPTSLAFGPDGRLYVAQLTGRIVALTLNPATKAVTDIQQISTDADFDNVLAIAFSPFDPPDPVSLYVVNTYVWAPEDSDPYPGAVVRLIGPDFTQREEIITGLPTSTHQHGTNGIAFGPDGELYIQQGSTTNAGIAGPIGADGDWPESPLSAATLVADIYAPGFDGHVRYDPPGALGDEVNQVGGDVHVFASGMRNPYDIVVHSNGKIYGTDNGPNEGHDGASTSCTTVGEDPWRLDELMVVMEGHYYGQPNRNRGRFDARECVYHPPEDAMGPDFLQADFTGPMVTIPSSSNGLAEYTSDTFGGQMKGDLIYVWFGPIFGTGGQVRRVVLSEDGLSVIEDTALADQLTGPLDVAVGPDGTIYVVEYTGHLITYLEPWED